MSLSATLVDLAVAISLAFILRNVWALVMGSIVFGIVKCLGSYRLHSYRPKLHWNWPVTKSLLNFGKHIFWINIMVFVITSGDDALVGKLLGLSMLGFYTMAFNIASIPMSSLSGVLSQVLFPAYAKIQSEPKRIDEAFQRTFEIVMIVLLPLTSMMIVLASNFTTVFLGERWLPIIPALQVLLFFGMFRSVSSLFYPLHLAVNRPDIQAKIKSLDLVTFLIFAYPLTIKWGIVGTSYAMAIVYFINMIMNIASTFYLIPLSWKKLGVSLLFPFFVSFTVIATFILIHSLKLHIGKIANFTLMLASCLGVATILVGIFRRRLLIDFIDSIKFS